MRHPALGRTMIAMRAATLLCLAACGDSHPPAPAVAPAPPPAPKVAAIAPTPAPAVKPMPPDPQQKADAELASRVKAALARVAGLQSFAIDVTASHGVVSLFGTAPNRAARDRAGKAAAQVDSVTTVQNNLAIVAGS